MRIDPVKCSLKHSGTEEQNSHVLQRLAAPFEQLDAAIAERHANAELAQTNETS